jgi:hypothetical protein
LVRWKCCCFGRYQVSVLHGGGKQTALTLCIYLQQHDLLQNETRYRHHST